MPYILAIVSVISFAAGFGVSHQIDKAEIQKMSFDITSANTLAATTLQKKTAEVETANATAIKLNSDLDASHEAFIATSNNYDQQLDSIRLYAESGPCNLGTTTASNSTRIPQNSADQTEFSEELDRMVKEKAKISDEAADYADKAYQFATLNNCGIAK